MSLLFRRFRDRGVLDRERMVFTVVSDVDVGEYVVFRTAVKNGAATNGIEDTFWFPDKNVKSGDFVVLYTKFGKSKEKLSDGRTRTHFFYWSLMDPIWASNEYAAVLLHVDSWHTTIPEGMTGAE